MACPPVNGPKDPWPHVLSLPWAQGGFVGDPTSLAHDNIVLTSITRYSIKFRVVRYGRDSQVIGCNWWGRSTNLKKGNLWSFLFVNNWTKKIHSMLYIVQDHTFLTSLRVICRWAPSNVRLHFWAHLCICTVGSYALLSVCMYVCLDVTWPKFTRPKFRSQQPLNLGSLNLVRTLTWMTQGLTLQVKVIGQRSRLPGQKTFQVSFDHLKGILRSRVTWVKVKGHMGQGQRSTLKVKVNGQGH